MENKTNEKLSDKLAKELNLSNKDLIKDLKKYENELEEEYDNRIIYLTQRAKYFKKLEKELEQEKEYEEKYKKATPLERMGMKLKFLTFGTSTMVYLFFGMFFGVLGIYRNCNEQTCEIQKPKETYGIEVFYDRGKELITKINSLENKIKYAEPQNSIKYSKQIDSLKEQHSHIKDGIEYLLINESDDAKSFTP